MKHTSIRKIRKSKNKKKSMKLRKKQSRSRPRKTHKKSRKQKKSSKIKIDGTIESSRNEWQCKRQIENANEHSLECYHKIKPTDTKEEIKKIDDYIDFLITAITSKLLKSETSKMIDTITSLETIKSLETDTENETISSLCNIEYDENTEGLFTVEELGILKSESITSFYITNIDFIVANNFLSDTVSNLLIRTDINLKKHRAIILHFYISENSIELESQLNNLSRKLAVDMPNNRVLIKKHIKGALTLPGLCYIKKLHRSYKSEPNNILHKTPYIIIDLASKPSSESSLINQIKNNIYEKGIDISYFDDNNRFNYPPILTLNLGNDKRKIEESIKRILTISPPYIFANNIELFSYSNEENIGNYVINFYCPYIYSIIEDNVKKIKVIVENDAEISKFLDEFLSNILAIITYYTEDIERVIKTKLNSRLAKGKIPDNASKLWKQTTSLSYYMIYAR